MQKSYFSDLGVIAPQAWNAQDHYSPHDPPDDIYLRTMSSCDGTGNSGAETCIKMGCELKLPQLSDFVQQVSPYDDEMWWGIKKNKELTTIIDKYV